MPKTKDKKSKLELPSLRDLIDAGAHFGHRRSRTNPESRKYTYLLRDRVYVIDVEKTLAKLEEAATAAEKLAAEGKNFLFVGTKPQAASVVEEIATKLGMPYINHRWLGGTLTNFETISSSLKKLERLEQLIDSRQFEAFTKKERGNIEKELAKLRKTFGGIRKMNTLPGALVIVDINEEDIATTEGRDLGIPVFALVDTNSNPNLVDYPIPANDDSQKTIRLVLEVFADAITEGSKKVPAKTEAKGDLQVTSSDKAAEETDDDRPVAKKKSKAERLAEVEAGKEKDGN